MGKTGVLTLFLFLEQKHPHNVGKTLCRSLRENFLGETSPQRGEDKAFKFCSTGYPETSPQRGEDLSEQNNLATLAETSPQRGEDP